MTSATTARSKSLDRWWQRVFVVLIVGLIVAIVWYDWHVTPSPALDKRDKWSDIRIAIAAGLTATFVWELSRAFARRVIAYLPRKKARHFFGLNLADSESDLQITIQSDLITNILSDAHYNIDSKLKVFDGDIAVDPKQPQAGSGPGRLDQLLNAKSLGRMYKARQWVNRFDAAGALEILLCLRNFDEQRTAQIVPVAHDRSPYLLKLRQQGLLVSMGLGFTDASLQILDRVCEGWAELVRVPEFGDCFLLDPDLLNHRTGFSLDDSSFGDLMCPENRARREGGRHKLNHEVNETGSPAGHWPKLTPKGWRIDRWLESDKSTNDYAVILRHTELENGIPKRVVFVCAGFTEYGTYLAGHYLASNWKELHARARCGDWLGRRGWGDFMAIVTGKSFDRSGWGISVFITPRILIDAMQSSETRSTELSSASNPACCSKCAWVDSEWVRRWHSADQHGMRERVRCIRRTVGPTTTDAS